MAEVAPEDQVLESPTTVLPERILSLLGEPSNKIIQGSTVHHDIAERWNAVLKKGLSAEARQSVIEKYPPILNILQTSKLNLEVKGAITDAAIRRDDRLREKQIEISAALSAVGHVLTSFLTSEDLENPLIEVVGDVGRILADLHFNETQSRRILSGTGINKKFQNTMTSSTPDERLFGGDLGERLRSAKVLERSATKLKQKTPVRKPSVTKPLNSRRPSSSVVRRPQYYPPDRTDVSCATGGEPRTEPRQKFQKRCSFQRGGGRQRRW